MGWKRSKGKARGAREEVKEGGRREEGVEQAGRRQAGGTAKKSNHGEGCPVKGLIAILLAYAQEQSGQVDQVYIVYPNELLLQQAGENFQIGD